MEMDESGGGCMTSTPYGYILTGTADGGKVQRKACFLVASLHHSIYNEVKKSHSFASNSQKK